MKVFLKVLLAVIFVSGPVLIQAEDNTRYASFSTSTLKETAYSTRTFLFDNVAPQSAFSHPADNRAYASVTTPLSGTAVDATSAIQEVKLLLQNQDSGKYWNHAGSTFSLSSPNWIDVSNLFTSSWT
jgi:hypothetical protein